ncbi:MAG: O-antigen ligase family protein, partial [Bacteroidales bacterium]|nr:O-antigen ligase family protein [Bacteroidales bacterium]
DYFNIGLKAFFLGLGIILLISIYEHLFLNHLPSDFSNHLNHIPPTHGDHKVPFATFGNPNNLAVYLVFSVILLRAYAWHTDKNKLLTNILTALSIGIIILTSSKFSIIALIVFFIFECFLYVISKNHFKISFLTRYSKWIGLAVFIMACVYFGGQQLIGYYENPKPINERDSEILMLSVQSPHQQDTIINSNQIRLNLVKNGIHFFKESKGFGQGAGSFRYLIESGKGPYPTRNIVNPHSWIFKLLANYGIPITLFFIGWLVYCAIIVIKGMIVIREHTKLIPYIFIGGGILLTYPFISNAPSSFVTNTVNWTMLITLAITCDKILMKLKQSPKKV